MVRGYKILLISPKHKQISYAFMKLGSNQIFTSSLKDTPLYRKIVTLEMVEYVQNSLKKVYIIDNSCFKPCKKIEKEKLQESSGTIEGQCCFV